MIENIKILNKFHIFVQIKNKKRIMGLFNVFTKEIAIDLGTANTLIIHNNKIVVDQPSIVAV